VMAFDAPSFEAMQALLMEPEMMSITNWQTMELKAAMTLEETWKMVQAQ